MKNLLDLVRVTFGLLLLLGLAQPVSAADTTTADELTAIEADLAALQGDGWKGAIDRLNLRGTESVKTAYLHLFNRRLNLWNGRPVLALDVGGDQRTVYPCTATLGDDSRPLGDPLATVSASTVSSLMVKPLARKEVQKALTLIDLYHSDANKRLAAVKDLGNKRIADSLPRLRELMGDGDDTMRREAEISIHLIAAADQRLPATERLPAISRLGELYSIRALDLLKDLRNRGDCPANEAPVLDTAIAAIDRHLGFTNWIRNIFSGLSLGSILLLTALGLAITFGLMGVINMAHGEMLMIGAVTTWACYEYIGTALPPAWFNWYYVLALPLSFLVAAAVGMLIEFFIVRFLYKRPLDSLLATIGVSLVLVQSVRAWKGDNLGMTAPTWFTGGWEPMPDVVLPYNRLFIIALTAACLLGVLALFKYTRFGLMLRATVQNRQMAAANGVNTRMVDLLTFGLGSGLAGIAGCALVLMTNPTPEMGGSYVVKSFLVVVVGGVGNLLGVVCSGLGLGFLEKVLEPLALLEHPIRIFDATWAQVAVLIVVVLFIQLRPGGLFPERGRMADRADGSAGSFIVPITKRMDLGFALVLGVVTLVLVPAAYGFGLLSPEFVNKLGYILCFAICAVGLDLVWGLSGTLSMCQAMFFAFGAYCMGLYLANHGPLVSGVPECLSYVSSSVDGAARPFFLDWFQNFPATVVLGILLPTAAAFVIGWTTFRSRVKGVYVAILTQAITVGANLVFMKNDLRLGGTNGLTKFGEILGFPIAGDPDAGRFSQTRFWLYIATVIVLGFAIWLARRIAHGGLGRVLVAVRDDESRLRFCGYQVWAWKLLIFAIAAAFAAIAGMLYVPQKGIINPHGLVAYASVLIVAYVAVGGRGTIWGAVLGSVAVGLLYEKLTSSWPAAWMYVLGGTFIAVPLWLPGGLLSLPGLLLRPQPPPPSDGDGHSTPKVPENKPATPIPAEAGVP